MYLDSVTVNLDGQMTLLGVVVQRHLSVNFHRVIKQ